MEQDLLELYRSLVHQTKVYTEFCKMKFGSEVWVQGLQEKKSSTPVISEPPISVSAPIYEPQIVTSETSSPMRITPIQYSKLSPALSLAERELAMQRIMAQASQCTRCTLHETRTQVVFSSGPIDAKIAIIGEAPGKFEDIQGIPFIGPAGELLTKMLAAINIKREEVYITNVVKCRPVPVGKDTARENRQPEEKEIVACSTWFTQQFHYVRPMAILAMGAIPVRGIFGRAQGINNSRLLNTSINPFRYRGIPVIFTYHPSYLLRYPNQKREAWKDLLILQELIRNVSQSV